MQDEQWKQIEGFPMYMVSDAGRVLSHHRNRSHILRPSAGHRGHLGVILYRDGQYNHRRIHVLVAEAFIGPRPTGQEVRHLNGVSDDNRLGNLAYGTSSQNKLDAVAHGAHVNARKTHCPRQHPYDEANTYLTASGRRMCRTCGRARSLAHYYRTVGASA